MRFGEVIATGADSASVIALADSTQIAVGERARVTLDEFVYQPGGDGGRMAPVADAGHVPLRHRRHAEACLCHSHAEHDHHRARDRVRAERRRGRHDDDRSRGRRNRGHGSAGNSIAVAAGRSVSLGASAAGGLPGGMGFSGMGPGDLAALHARSREWILALSAAAGNTGPGGDLSRALGSARADAIGKQPPGSTPPGPSTPGASTPGPRGQGLDCHRTRRHWASRARPAGSEIGKANRGPAGKGKPSRITMGRARPITRA